MKQSKHFPLLPFLAICLVIIALALPSSVPTAAATSLYQGQGGAWDTAVRHEPWIFYGLDIVNGAETCEAHMKEVRDVRMGSACFTEVKNISGRANIDIFRNHPTKQANLFKVTPWVSKLEDSDPYHDWYLLDLRVFDDANLASAISNQAVSFVDVTDRKENSGDILHGYSVGWWANNRDVLVKSGSPQKVFLIDWAPKTQAETRTQTTMKSSGFECEIGAEISIEGPTAGPECSMSFSSAEATSSTVSDVGLDEIKRHLWVPGAANTGEADFVWWPERFNIGTGDEGKPIIPPVSFTDYQSNRMMVWETSEPVDGALLDMYMWAIYEYKNYRKWDYSMRLSTNPLASFTTVDRICLGIKPGPADATQGCVTGKNNNDIRIVTPPASGSAASADNRELFRLVQYRPPVIPLTQQPTSTSPVWVNDKVTVTFDGVKDPDGDYLLYQFDFGDGTFYPSSDCAKNPTGDGCQDTVCYGVCVGRACGSIKQDCLTVKCDTDGCFGPSLTAQHAWTHSKAADLMGVKAVRVRAAEAQCFPSPSPSNPTPESECVTKARLKDYNISDNYNYKSGWSGSFPVSIQGLSSISIDGPVSGDLSDDSTWTMKCNGKWYNQGTPFDEDCSACNEGLTWAVTDGAGNPTKLAAIDPSGLLQVNTLPKGKTIDNIMVKASCKDHGVTKADSISLAIKSSATVKPNNAPNETGWQNIATAALALFALLSLVLFAWIGWRWDFKPKRKQQK